MKTFYFLFKINKTLSEVITLIDEFLKISGFSIKKLKMIEDNLTC